MQTEPAPVETTPLRSRPTISLDLSMGDSPHIDALYERGYKTVDELLGVTELIVRATPVSVDFESAVGRCWILLVGEADRKCPETIRLAQLKDEFLLEEGEEAVLALQLDHSNGRYYIPGGGDGLFPTDKNGADPPGCPNSIRLYRPLSKDGEPKTARRLFPLLPPKNPRKAIPFLPENCYNKEDYTAERMFVCLILCKKSGKRG